MQGETILTVENLTVRFDSESGPVRAVQDVNFTVDAGKTLGIVGESGCGKSVTALSIMRLLPRPAGQIEAGHIYFNGLDIAAAPAHAMPAVRGNQISMIFQEPMTALNPVHPIGRQVAEVFRLHHPQMAAAEIEKQSLAMLAKVGIPDPRQRLREYPHQMSGGMRQRVMIAIALACRPRLLIADEPTTALDVTVQAQILELMADLQRETGMAMMFITHDLGVIAGICQDVVVMYAGNVVESAPVNTLFAQPLHPYTQGLMRAAPRLDSAHKQDLPVIAGMVPGLADLPRGCRFENRCEHAMDVCRDVMPDITRIDNQHGVRCHLY